MGHGGVRGGEASGGEVGLLGGGGTGGREPWESLGDSGGWGLQAKGIPQSSHRGFGVGGSRAGTAVLPPLTSPLPAVSSARAAVGHGGGGSFVSRCGLNEKQRGASELCCATPPISPPPCLPPRDWGVMGKAGSIQCLQ